MNFKKASLLIFAVLFSAVIAFAQKRNINIVFIGNSITYGAGLPDRNTQSPPVICANYLREQSNIGTVEISNQGHSGFTTLDWLPGTKAFITAESCCQGFWR
ncbi:hypothetical protein [Mucilaginibacter sp. UYCu711]|uniref:hypothetical protein n=1 Tax=Mucilaginibacter sp. UYCu711 TaxID=3156339 RepID=UPI003D25311C